MLPSDITDSPADIMRILRELRHAVDQLETARRLEKATIGSGGLRITNEGSLTIEDGGDVILIDGGKLLVKGGQFELVTDQGIRLAYFGPLNGDSAGNPGWRLNYDSGESALQLQGAVGEQFVAIRDLAEQTVVSTDALSGRGLGAPFIPFRLVPSSGAQQDGTSFWPSATSSTAVKLMQGINPIFHPRISIGVLISSVTGVGHWRLDVNGVTVIADETVSGVHTVTIPGWATHIPGTPLGIDLYGWITGGGRVSIQCDRIYGQQS